MGYFNLSHPVPVHNTCIRKVYSSCVRCMLNWSKTWPVRKENELALARAEMKMVRWICVYSNVILRDRLGADCTHRARY